MEQKYEEMKQEFVKIRALVCEIADVLDAEFPAFVIEEDKTLRYKQMVISTSPEKNQGEGLDPQRAGASNQFAVQPINQYLDRRHQNPKPRFFPFDDELSFNFYRELPDYSHLVLSADETSYILRVANIDNQELMEEEIARIQKEIDERERSGSTGTSEQQPALEMPDESELEQRVQEIRKKSVNCWVDADFDDFRRKMQKSQSK